MANEVIMLAKTYRKHKDLTLPASVQEKLDGVPGDFYYKRELGRVHARTRQGEELHSVDHIIAALTHALPDGAHVIGELRIAGMDFKDISGIARRHKTDVDTIKLKLHVFDFYIEGEEDCDFWDRMDSALRYLWELAKAPDSVVKFIPGCRIDTPEQLDEAVANFKRDNPESEGVVIRALTGKKSVYKAAWRSPGMLKLKWTETIDVPIDSFEEAVSKDGQPMGMVGRINVLYNGKVSGVGPGKMKHEDRIAMWKDRKNQVGKMIEVAHMPDESYEGLREGRYYRHRPDKD